MLRGLARLQQKKKSPGEDGLVGAVLTVSDAGQTVATATTAGDGSYAVGGLPAGSFTVAVDPASVPGLNPASDLDGLADHQTTVLLAAGENRSDVDFGYNGDGALGDRLFLDLDSDGLEGPGEPGIVGADVELLDDPGMPIATTTSVAGGLYQFTSVPDGLYTVRVVTATLPWLGQRDAAAFLLRSRRQRRQRQRLHRLLLGGNSSSANHPQLVVIYQQ